MGPQRLRAFRADRPSLDEPKHFTRIPDDALEDPRLTKAQLSVFINLVKNNWTGSKVLYVTQRELADRARVTDRCVRDALARLEGCGYIRRQRDYQRAGGPTRIELCYELRPSLKLESQPPVTSGSKSTCNRKRRSAPDRKPHSAPERKLGSGPSLFEERDVRETTTAVVEITSSFSQDSEPKTTETQAVIDAEPAEDPPDDPETPELDQILAAAMEHWPEEPNLAARVRKLAGQGLPETALAIEYAVLRKAKGFGYVASTVARWWADGWDLADIQAEVWGARPKGRKPDPVVIHRRSEPPPTDPETEALLARGRWWDTLKPDEKTGCGTVAKLPPQPAGVHPQRPTLPSQGEHTMKGCSPQELRQTAHDGQRARQDSNLQPSDSKSATLSSPGCLDSSAKTVDGQTPVEGDSKITLGLPIRGSNSAQELGTSCPNSPQPNKAKTDA
jgi:hypothetical protein